MDFESKYWVAVFPYIKTTNEVRYKSIRIISSLDISNVPSEISEYVKELCSSFYLRHDVQIENVSFAYHITEEEVKCPTNFINDLDEFQTLIRYIYSSPHETFGDPFLNYEHSYYFLFRPKLVSKYLLFSEHNTIVHANINNYSIDESKSIQGYECLLNNRSTFWITRKDQITPPTARIWLNISQDISSDFKTTSPIYHPVISFFSYKTDNDELRSRLLTSLNWYNRTLLSDIDDDITLVNLSIAFECLLGLEQGNKVTERFKETVNVLLGGFPRLDSWLSQFYHARSEIVHDGRSQRLAFLPVDKYNIKANSEPAHQSLISYGRHIFQACTASILTGSMLAEHMNLPSRLVTNQQRVRSITEKLDSKTTSAQDAILSAEKEIIEIESYRFVPESGLKVDDLLSVGISLSKRYTEIESFKELAEFNKKIKDLSKNKAKDHLLTLSSLHEVTELMKKIPSRLILENKVLHLTKSLLESIWHYLIMHYFKLKRDNEQQN